MPTASKAKHLQALYHRVIQLYPASYRNRFAPEMEQVLRDQLAASPAGGRIWLRAFGELPFSLIHEHVINFQEITMQTPQATRQSHRDLLIGALLMTPILVMIGALIIYRSLTNGGDISTSSAGHYFYARWTAPVLGLVFPLIALAINAMPVVGRLKSSNWRFWEVSSYQNSWLNMGFLILALGFVAFLFGHDSLHCVAHNPIFVARHLGATFDCLKNN